MNFDFNTITEAQEKEVVTKFKEYGKGIAMGKYSTQDANNVSTWNDLIDLSLFSERAIKEKMLQIAQTINTICNDSMLGDLTTAFSFKDERNRTVKFSHLDLYIFLRAVLRYRRDTAEYKEKLVKLKEAKKFIENNKSTEDRLKEQQALLATLQKELGEDIEV